MSTRREFITLLGAAASWPVAARAQSAMPVIGLLGATSFETNVDRLRAFRQGLKEIGYVEGENVAIEYRWAKGDYHRLAAQAAELVRRRVAVILVASTDNRRPVPALCFSERLVTLRLANPSDQQLTRPA
jgi:ABC-type uncharacterized transport system substrate-binding protein